jgi:hypothetical protein
LHLVGYLYYWQMGFNSVFKGLKEYELYDVMQVRLLSSSTKSSDLQKKY